MKLENKSIFIKIMQNWLDSNGFISLPLPVNLTKPFHLTDDISIIDTIHGEGLWSYNLITHEIWLVLVYKNNIEEVIELLDYSDHIHILIDEQSEEKYNIDYSKIDSLGIGVISIKTEDSDHDLEDRITFAKIGKLKCLRDDVRICYTELILMTQLKRPWWVTMVKDSFKLSPTSEMESPTKSENTERQQLWEHIQQFIESKISLIVDEPIRILEYLDQEDIDRHATLQEQIKIKEELSKFYDSDLTYTTTFLQKIGFSIP